MVEDLFCALSKERGAGCVGRAESGGEHGELGEVEQTHGERMNVILVEEKESEGEESRALPKLNALSQK